MSSFHPLEVVGRGSETQLQVGETLNTISTGTGCFHFQPASHLASLPTSLPAI